MPVLLVAAGLLGLAVGSFLNVVIHRLPRGESLVRPGSHCPTCHSEVRARHNVPVLGWLMLRGRCADCATPISIRYPLVEFATGVLFVAVTAQVVHLGQLPALPGYLFFTAAGIALAAIDLDVHRLPNAIVYSCYLALAVGFGTAAAIEGSAQPLVRAAIGAVALFGLYLVIALARPGGMGLGDVKLAGAIGAALGFLSYPALVVGAFAAFVLGGLAAVAMTARRGATRRTALPFGPAMVGGALLAVFAGAPLAEGYLRLAQRS